MALAVSDGAWLQAMLDVEAALARACAEAGEIPAAAAEAIAAACVAERFDIAAIGRDTADHASPVVPLVDALRAAVGDEAAEHVHHGATSQDIVDTAAMLVAKRALDPLLRDAHAAADAAAALADAHRATPVAGRTLMQRALPTSFGLKAASWLDGITQARTELARVRSSVLAVQMGGPVGNRSPAVAGHVARELDLTDPVVPWHPTRVRPAALAAALGALTGVLAKVAGDVVLMAQDEVGELREGGLSGSARSSSMPHKRNPAASVTVIACAERVPGLVATMFATMPHEHERAAGRWQAEWGTLSDLLRLTGSATAWAADLLGNLGVDTQRMRANLGDEPVDLAAADQLIDRALQAHRTT